MIERITDACNGCGVCALACPKDAIAMRPSSANRKGKVAHIVEAQRCYVCYTCERLCPVDAIVMNDDKPPEAFRKRTPAYGEPGAAPASRRPRTQRQDILVIGAGAAGLATALAAREVGAAVTVIEKAPDISDTNTSRAGGGITIAMERELNPKAPRMTPEEKVQEALAISDGHADPGLVRAWAENVDGTMDWLRARGFRFGKSQLLAGHSMKAATRFALGAGGGLNKQLLAIAQRLGCRIQFSSRAERLITDQRGAVTGAVVRAPAGMTDFEASAVVLATAGFQANQEMLLRYFGPEQAYNFRLTGSPWATGDGHLMAAEAGAQMVNMNVCHGRNIDSSWIPGSTGREGPGRDLQVTCHRGIWVNRLGRRFVDESSTSDILANCVRAQPGQEAAIVYDERIRAMLPVETEHYRPRNIVRGFDSLRELAEGTGLPYEALARTLKDYNAAALEGRASDLDVPKREWAMPLETPPFYVVCPVWFGLNCTLGGPKIDPQGQVLDRDDLPIPGLLAAGEMIGGFFFGRHHATPGGAVYWKGNYQVTTAALSMCLVFGRIAGASAARRALGE